MYESYQIIPTNGLFVLISMRLSIEDADKLQTQLQEMETEINLKTEVPPEAVELPLDTKIHVFPRLEALFAHITMLEALKR